MHVTVCRCKDSDNSERVAWIAAIIFLTSILMGFVFLVFWPTDYVGECVRILGERPVYVVTAHKDWTLELRNAEFYTTSYDNKVVIVECP